MGESLIAVTGATGQLGGLVVEALLRRGVQVRVADYSRPETLGAAFEGAGRVLLVSGNEVGSRVAQHENVVRAAGRGGGRLHAHTSILRADTSGLLLAEEHKAT